MTPKNPRSRAAHLSPRAVLLMAVLGLFAVFVLAQCMMGRDKGTIEPSATALAGEGKPILVAQKMPVAPLPAPERLFQKFDALEQEKEDLAWRRWEALSPVEQARLILRHEKQAAPSEQELEAVTEARAREILACYERPGGEGPRALRAYALHLLQDEEFRAFEARRQVLVRDLAARGEEVVSALLEEIHRTGPHRDEAQAALSQMGRKATPALLKALESTEKDWIRADLLGALAGAKDPRARETFRHALNDGDASVRLAALEGLENLGPVSQEVYRRCLEDADASMRLNAIHGLGEVRDTQAIPALLEVARYDLTMDKGGFWLRREARAALEKIAARTGTKVDLPPEEPHFGRRPFRWTFDEVATAARCRNAGLRQHAARLLGHWFHDRRALELLWNLARQDPHPSVRAAAVSALGDLFTDSGQVQALPLSTKEREEVFAFLLDLVPQQEGEIGFRAFQSIGRLGAKNWPAFRRFSEFFSVVLRWIEGDDSRRQQAGLSVLSGLGYAAPEALERHLTPEQRAALQPHLRIGMEHPEVGVRIRFIEALGCLRERSVVPRLIELLREEDPTVRSFVIGALGRIGDERAIPALEKVSTDDPAQDREGRFYLRERARKAADQIRGMDGPGEG